MADAKKPGAEGRRHQRRAVEGFTLTAYRTQAASAHRPRKNIGEAILDISAGGVRLKVTEPVEKATSITIEIKELATGDIFHARGDVRWVESKNVEGKPQYFIGVQFVEVFTPLAKREKFFYGKAVLAAKRQPSETLPTIKSSSPTTLGKPLTAVQPQPGSDAGPEGRRAERVQVDDYVVTAFRSGLLSSVGLRKNLATEVVDLSSTGAQIVCKEKIEKGVKLQFTLHLNKFSDTLEAEADVVWVKEGPSPAGTVYFTGITFRPLSPQQKRLLEYMMSWFTSYQAKYRQAHKDL